MNVIIIHSVFISKGCGEFSSLYYHFIISFYQFELSLYVISSCFYKLMYRFDHKIIHNNKHLINDPP